MYKQIIIARKDLNMSAGKLAAQVAHASMAFMINTIKEKSHLSKVVDDNDNITKHYLLSPVRIDLNLYEQWIDDEYKKVVLQAKNRNKLYKAMELAKELGMQENVDYFRIYDNCHTELTPEDDGKVFTCIGFKPMDCEIIDKIASKFHMYV